MTAGYRGSAGRAKVVGGASGLTLIEILVVIVVMVIAVGVVAPAFLTPEHDGDWSELARVVRIARTTAAKRGEMLHVRIGTSGGWQVEATASLEDGTLGSGSLAHYEGPAATIIVSPVGTCAFDVRSTEAALAIPLDPMTCEIVAP